MVVINGIFLANVPDHLSPLASGIQACSAGDMTEVPKAWGLGASVCSHFPSFILRKASILKLTILLWQMSDHLSLASPCRSSIISFGAVGFRSSSAARSSSSPNSPAALGSVVAKFFMLDRAAPPCSTPPPHRRSSCRQTSLKYSILQRTSQVTYPWSRRVGCASSPRDDGMGLGEPSCSHFPSFILRMASFCKLTILLWHMPDHLSLTSSCRSAIIPFGAVGFRSSSAARSGSSQNCLRCSRCGRRAILHAGVGSPPCSTPPPHRRPLCRQTSPG